MSILSKVFDFDALIDYLKSSVFDKLLKQLSVGLNYGEYIVSAYKIIKFFIDDSPSNKNLKYEYGIGFNPVEKIGSTGNDMIIGSKVEDKIFGNYGSDKIFGGDSDDELHGGDSDYSPNDQADFIYGGSGNDTIWGNGGDDALFGDTGKDFIQGGRGNDLIYGGAGRDVLIGNEGADRFIFTAMTDSPVYQPKNRGNPDVIVDFAPRTGDKIDLSQIDANINIRGNNDFKIGGLQYTNGAIDIKAGQLVAWKSEGDTFVQFWDGNKSGPSGLIKLENFQESLQKDYFIL